MNLQNPQNGSSFSSLFPFPGRGSLSVEVLFTKLWEIHVYYCYANQFSTGAIRTPHKQTVRASITCNRLVLALVNLLVVPVVDWS